MTLKTEGYKYTMKSTFFTKIIDKTEIEIDTSYSLTIQRLKAQQGICRETDSRDIKLEFLCHNDGRLAVCNLSRHKKRLESDRLYSVVGEVTEGENKTKITIYSIYNRGYLLSDFIPFICIPTLIVFCLCTAFLSNYEFTTVQLYSMLFGIISLILLPGRRHKEKRNKTRDLEIMKNEIIKRVNAIERWDD